MKRLISILVVMFFCLASTAVFAGRGGGGSFSSGRSFSSSSRSYSMSSSRSSYSSSSRASSFTKSSSAFKSYSMKSNSGVSKMASMKSGISSPSSSNFTRSSFNRSSMRSDMGVGSYHPYNNWFLWYYIISSTHTKKGASDSDIENAYNNSTMTFIAKDFREQYPDVGITDKMSNWKFGESGISFECKNKRYVATSKGDKLFYKVSCADIKAEKAKEEFVLKVILGVFIGFVVLAIGAAVIATIRS